MPESGLDDIDTPQRNILPDVIVTIRYTSEFGPAEFEP